MYTFDIKNLIISIDNQVVTDLAEGSTVTVKNVQPKLIPHYGLQGKVGVARNGVDAKAITFQVMANSPDCKRITRLANRGAIFPCAWVDTNDYGEQYSHSQCFMEEVPEVSTGNEIGAVDVTITLPLGG